MILGIDLSHRHTGVARVEYLEDPRPAVTVWHMQVFNLKPKGKTFVDLVCEIHDIKNLIGDILDQVKEADEVHIEIPLLGGKPHAMTYRSFGVCHAIAAAIIKEKPTTQLISPYHLKEWSGSKKNKKEHVDKKVREKFGSLITTKNDNIIDALAICTIRTDELTRQFYSNQRQSATDAFRLSSD